ncbi:MAG TPA: hypothetical protein VKY92_03230 [Verrucomicrobiae bacterium]|nr:hypothetical protein [Verrucomicrobiae bacterium]
MRLDELMAWLGWLGQVVRGYVASAAHLRAQAVKRSEPAPTEGLAEVHTVPQ